jgi:hypothetical protein
MEQNQRYIIIRKIYLYFLSLVGLVLIVIALVRLVDLGLRVYVFKGAEEVVVWPEPGPIRVPGIKPGEERELTTEEKAAWEEKQRQTRVKENLRQRHRTASNSIAMIIVGLPLYLYHWRIIKKET